MSVRKGKSENEKLSEKPKKKASELSNPPSSKNSFRIKTQGGNKKLMEDLLRINEEERKAQG